jgi:RimJ/RimL family protein N-acetyltransferase
MKYVDDSRPFESFDEAEASILRGIDYYNRHGICHFCVDEKSSGKMIGHCGFNLYRGGPALELVFHFNRQWWGKGFATEAALACLDYAFDKLAAQSVVALTFPENTDSINVLKKIGLNFDGEIVDDGATLRKYSLSRV